MHFLMSGCFMVLSKMHVGVTLHILVNTLVHALHAAVTVCTLFCLRSLVSYECNFIDYIA
jgi:hypothetical protein